MWAGPGAMSQGKMSQAKRSHGLISVSAASVGGVSEGTEQQRNVEVLVGVVDSEHHGGQWVEGIAVTARVKGEAVCTGLQRMAAQQLTDASVFVRSGFGQDLWRGAVKKFQKDGEVGCGLSDGCVEYMGADAWHAMSLHTALPHGATSAAGRVADGRICRSSSLSIPAITPVLISASFGVLAESLMVVNWRISSHWPPG